MEEARATGFRAGCRAVALLALLALALLTAACGSRLTREDLVAGARASVDSSGGAARPSTSADVATGETASEAGRTATNPSIDAAATVTSVASPAGAGTAAVGATDGRCAKSLEPITIGSVGETTGIVGRHVQPAITAVKAWTAAMNARGGIHCHPVRYISLDDGGDPARHQALTRQLIERDNVLALVFTAAPLAGRSSVAYVNQSGVPAIGSETASDWWYDNSGYYPQTTSGVDATTSTFAAMGRVGRTEGMTKLASLTCIEASICSGAYTLAPTAAERYGLDLVYRAQGSLAQPDYTANCQAAKDAGAQLFYIGMDANSIDRIARSCASIGYRPTYALVNLVTEPQLADNPLLEGAISAQNMMPWFNTASPAVAELHEALRRFAPGHEATPSGVAGWTAAKLFETAAAHLSEPPTRESLVDGLHMIRGNDLGGLTAPLTFRPGDGHRVPLCYWITRIRGGRFTNTDDFTRICEDP